MKLLPRRNVSLYTAKTETDNHNNNNFSCKFKYHYKTPVFARN